MEKIQPAFYENNVPICFSINDKYVPLLAVTIESIIENSSSDFNYDIVILITGVNAKNQTLLFSLIRNHPNFSIRFFNVGKEVYGYNFFIESALGNTKYSNEIYYRVLVPSLMPDYDHVIFLDADLVVTTDIAELLNYDYSNYLVGAVRDYEGIATCFNNNYERTKYRLNELGIKTFEDYFVSGVLVINVKMFNSLFSGEDLLRMAVSKNWIQFDQDLLNYICKDKVKIIDASWDFVEDIYNQYKSMPKKLFNEYIESEKNPKIIHYSGNRKPWKNKTSVYSAEFWKYAKNTPFFDTLNHLNNVL